MRLQLAIVIRCTRITRPHQQVTDSESPAPFNVINYIHEERNHITARAVRKAHRLVHQHCLRHRLASRRIGTGAARSLPTRPSCGRTSLHHPCTLPTPLWTLTMKATNSSSPRPWQATMEPSGYNNMGRRSCGCSPLRPYASSCAVKCRTSKNRHTTTPK